jgi:hypothetical protein
MPTYVVLTRLTPETVKSPRDLQRLERAVSERIRKESIWTSSRRRTRRRPLGS